MLPYQGNGEGISWKHRVLAINIQKSMTLPQSCVMNVHTHKFPLFFFDYTDDTFGIS